MAKVRIGKIEEELIEKICKVYPYVSYTDEELKKYDDLLININKDNQFQYHLRYKGLGKI